MDGLEQTLRNAVANRVWFRLESVERMSQFEDFGILEGVSRPLFLDPAKQDEAGKILSAWVAAGRLEREWEILCPRCKQQCSRQATAEETAEHWVGLLVDCPHCQLEFPCPTNYLHPVYLVGDAYYRSEGSPAKSRLRPSALAERALERKAR